MRLVTSVCLSLMTVAVTAGNVVAAAPLVEGGDTVVTYNFNDLSATNCGMWGGTTSGLYQDLEFPSPTYMTVCSTQNGTNGLQPSAFAAGLVEVRVKLPSAAMSVSVESFLYQYGEAPTLIAYDSTGVELGRMSAGAMNIWSTLEVQAGDTPIAEIGLLLPQLVGYIDNLKVSYGLPAPPEPDVVPEPEPEPQPEATDPVSIADCRKAGWMEFGFRNQGQCVSFVRNGRDSR